MGASSSNYNPIFEQIKNYYLFQKKIELILKNGINPYFDLTKPTIDIEPIYIIDHNWIKEWNSKSYYSIPKESFDKIEKDINPKNEKYFLQEMDSILQNLTKVIFQFNLPLRDNSAEYNRFISRNMLNDEDFECLVNEKTYKLFKKHKKDLYLFFKERFNIKILYHGILEAKKELIQLTANSLIIKNNVINIEKSLEIFNELKNYFKTHDTNFLIKNFNSLNIGFYQSKSVQLGKRLSFTLKNEVLTFKYLEKEKRIQDIHFQNVNKIKRIGLVNVGATCYMNATLQCFINVDSLIRYLLTESNYYKIINNLKKCELSSAFCELLVNVCCDENIINNYKPQKFKDIISSKNPLFQGINANDSKDLINFLLEEMNHELSSLNIQKENDINRNIQINQTDKNMVLSYFKNEFTKNNNSIICQIFFFICENITKCLTCNTVKYNYQAIYLLEFPLETVYKFCLSNNINPINNKGEICLNLYQCFEQYRSPTFFTGENKFYCNICRDQKESIYFNNIYSLPPVLIIILNRGRGNSFNCKVDFPKLISLQQYINCQESIYSYELKGVITHLGESGMGGHFIAYCKHRLDGNWYCYNDAIVTYLDDQENGFRKGTPYILFYESNDKRNNILFNQNINYMNNIFNNANNLNNVNAINNNLFNNMNQNNNNINFINNLNNNFNMVNNNNQNMNINFNNNNNYNNGNINYNMINNNQNMNNINNNLNARTFNNNIVNNNQNMNNFNNNYNKNNNNLIQGNNNCNMINNQNMNNFNNNNNCNNGNNNYNLINNQNINNNNINSNNGNINMFNNNQNMNNVKINNFFLNNNKNNFNRKNQNNNNMNNMNNMNNQNNMNNMNNMNNISNQNNMNNMNNFNKNNMNNMNNFINHNNNLNSNNVNNYNNNMNSNNVNNYINNMMNNNMMNNNMMNNMGNNNNFN